MTLVAPGDVDASGVVDVLDLLALLGAWGPAARRARRISMVMVK